MQNDTMSGLKVYGADVLVESSLRRVCVWNCSARMSFEDFLKEFDRLWVCHLEPDTVAEEIFSTNVCTMLYILCTTQTF